MALRVESHHESDFFLHKVESKPGDDINPHLVVAKSVLLTLPLPFYYIIEMNIYAYLYILVNSDGGSDSGAVRPAISENVIRQTVGRWSHGSFNFPLLNLLLDPQSSRSRRACLENDALSLKASQFVPSVVPLKLLLMKSQL